MSKVQDVMDAGPGGDWSGLRMRTQEYISSWVDALPRDESRLSKWWLAYTPDCLKDPHDDTEQYLSAWDTCIYILHQSGSELGLQVRGEYLYVHSF